MLDQVIHLTGRLSQLAEHIWLGWLCHLVALLGWPSGHVDVNVKVSLFLGTSVKAVSVGMMGISLHNKMNGLRHYTRSTYNTTIH